MAPKAKAQKMSLGDFLGDQALGSWADEMEDMPPPSESRPGPERRAVSSAAGFGDRSFDSNREDRYPPREPLPLPTKPPYTAHLGNLPFDASQEHIEEFLEGCEVTSVRIVEDREQRRPKGFGYVEFATLDGLKKALTLNLSQFRNRNIKISVADPPKDRQDAREQLDWTRRGPLPDLPNNNRRVSERGPPGMERGGSRRGGPALEADGKERDFSNWERKGPLSPLPTEPRANNKVRDGPRERKSSPSWGEGQSQDGSRPPRERPAPVERQPTAAELDNQWRSRMRPEGVKEKSPTPETSTPSSPKPATVRPKLNLQKRTVSEAEPGSAVAASDSKASPFGAARPIDTATREREVEEKRQLVIRQKREADQKAAEEKKAQEAESNEEDATTSTTNTEKSKANGESSTPSRNFQILARMTEENGEEDDIEESSTPVVQTSKQEKTEKTEKVEKSEKSNGTPPTESAEQRPTQRGRGAPRGPKGFGGSWRGRKPSHNSNSESSPRSANAEDDGWSTVPAKPRGRGGRGRGS